MHKEQSKNRKIFRLPLWMLPKKSNVKSFHESCTHSIGYCKVASKKLIRKSRFFWVFDMFSIKETRNYLWHVFSLDISPLIHGCMLHQWNLPAETKIAHSLLVKLPFLPWVNRIPLVSMLPCVNMRDHASRSFLFLSFFIKIGSRDLIISLFCFLP